MCHNYLTIIISFLLLPLRLCLSVCNDVDSSMILIPNCTLNVTTRFINRIFCIIKKFSMASAEFPGEADRYGSCRTSSTYNTSQLLTHFSTIQYENKRRSKLWCKVNNIRITVKYRRVGIIRVYRANQYVDTEKNGIICI